MKNKNGNNYNASILEQNKLKEIPLKIINEKYSKNELEIEDILQNDDCINDLITRSNSRYKKIITIENLKKLIKNCLKPGWIKDDILRYPYYSCQILCSQNALFFQKSIKNLKKNKEKKNEINNNVNINNNSNIIITSEEEKQYINKAEENNHHYQLEEDNNENSNYEESYSNFYDNIISGEEYEKIEEKYVDFFQYKTETEQKSKSKSRKNPTEYDKEDLDIIYEILDEIFKILDLKECDINQTYIGYFQKIVNYLLFNEPDITIKYLFKDKIPIITKFYNNVNSASMQNILENILNLISDLEYNNNEDIKNSKYLQIIKGLWNILIENNNLNNYEFICQLIINTLINNSEKQLIEFIFNDDYAMENIKNSIGKIIEENNNDKKLIGIIDILCNLNNIIMNSVLETSIYKNNDNLDIFINDYRKINIFEYQYICKKNISYKKVFESFQQNELKYSKIINEIYLIIKNNIKKLYSSNINNINNINIKTETGINENFGFNNLCKWRFILSSLKLYIYSLNVIENKDNSDEEYKKYFYDEEFFYISIKLYFFYRKNNLYQNIFLEIFKLICNEKSPSYLIFQMLSNKYFEDKKNILNIILKNLENENKNKKNNLLIGPDIELLKIVYFSKNKEIINYLQHNNLDNKKKDIYINSIFDKFERTLFNDEYDLSFSEIFLHDNDDTFDGNDDKLETKIKPIHELIEHYLNKNKDEEEKYINKKIKTKIKVTEKIDGSIIKTKIIESIYNNIKGKDKIIEYDNSNKSDKNEKDIFGIQKEVEDFELLFDKKKKIIV